MRALTILGVLFLVFSSQKATASQDKTQLRAHLNSLLLTEYYCEQHQAGSYLSYSVKKVLKRICEKNKKGVTFTEKLVLKIGGAVDSPMLRDKIKEKFQKKKLQTQSEVLKAFIDNEYDILHRIHKSAKSFENIEVLNYFYQLGYGHSLNWSFLIQLKGERLPTSLFNFNREKN